MTKIELHGRQEEIKEILAVLALVAYDHREDLVRYIRCQEEAHNTHFSCEQIRRMAFELLVERVEIDRQELHRAVFHEDWCPAQEIFRGEDEEHRWAGHPPCP